MAYYRKSDSDLYLFEFDTGTKSRLWCCMWCELRHGKDAYLKSKAHALGHWVRHRLMGHHAPWRGIWLLLTEEE